jgi:hypothetical protein
MKRSLERAPPRLSTRDAELRALFEQADQDYRRELQLSARSEEAAFRGLSERLRSGSAGLGPQRSRWRLAGALSVAVCLLALGTLIGRGPSASPSSLRMTRESLPVEPARAEATTPAEREHDQPPPAPLRAQPTRARSASSRAKLEPRPAAAGDTPSSPAPAAATSVDPRPERRPAPPAVPDPDCLALARAGEPRAAEQCFSAQATGNGLAAEMALYEVARLRRDVLGDADGALAALDDHRARFARGSLRQEVDVFRVELLARLGRAREALASSAALLASPGGRERAAELHLLRGNIYRQDLADPVSAAREYEQARALGGAAGEQARRRLEQLGPALEQPRGSAEVRP